MQSNEIYRNRRKERGKFIAPTFLSSHNRLLGNDSLGGSKDCAFEGHFKTINGNLKHFDA